MVEAEGAIELRVAGARKRDAGRGIARLAEAARSRLGVLSGDPVIVEGERQTVAKVWPGTDDPGRVRIDADTRENASVTIGDDVLVRRADVSEADAITIQRTDEARSDPVPSETAGRRLRDRLLRAGERVRIPGFGPYVALETDPEGSVRVTERTVVTVAEGVAPDGAGLGSAGLDGSPVGADRSGTEMDDSGRSEGTDESEAARERTTYEDIGGLDDELELVRETIELPLREPETFSELSVRPPTGVLLHGPPGTGKTLIARAVANEVDATFEVISGPEIVSKYKGESAERLRAAFERARDGAPAILFVDEIDSIAGARDDEADMETRVVAQLLTLMDGLERQEGVIVVGATNRIDAVDSALRRGGRFDREIEIGVPDERGRRQILAVHTRGMPLGEDVDLDRLAERTHGFVGADLESLVREAALIALRRDEEEPRVTRADFESALSAVDPSAMREYVAQSPAVTFEAVGGLEDAKGRLREAVQWPLSYGPLFEAANTDPPTGVLLSGPPGTGKTLLARATAGESGVNFLEVAGPELLDRFVGESEQGVRDLFERARRTAPAIVFLDELDAVATVRGGENDVTDRVVSQLLTELDRAADNPNLVVLAATNRRDAIDEAMLRPGRLEADISVPAPDEAARREILGVHARGKPLGEDVDLDDLATETESFTGAELEAVVREAAMLAIREVATDVDPQEAPTRADDVIIERAHFETALDRQRESRE